MCGINGILNLGSPAQHPAVQTAALQAMNLAIAHRGPDGEGLWQDDLIALGHRRLAILDLSAAGHQPMFNEDEQLVLVFNGEIYNYLELIPELTARGHRFRSRTDSEVILHAYEEWGPRCVERFNGMWAFAIWDRRTRRLFASRDRLGVKPFFYRTSGEQLVFSSEVAGIRAAVPVHEANLAKLHDYLAYGYRINDGQTLFAGIHELPPGHNLLVQDGRLHLSRYWQLPEQPTAVPAGERVEAFRALLIDAVKLRFRSDVPVALLQSGGLDSSAICAVVNDEIAAGRLGFDRVTGYTAVHPGHRYDESEAVQALMATCPQVQSVQLEPRGDDLAAEFMRFTQAMQEPVFSATAYAHWRLMRAVREQGIKVVINGQGADEALAGYGNYIVGYRLLDLLLSRPLQALAEAQAMHRRMGLGYGQLAAQLGKAMAGRRAASRWRASHTEGAAAVLSADFQRQHAEHLPELGMQWQPANLDQHLRSQLMHFGFNQILHYEDQSSMSQSVEIRSPFIDYRLMEFAFSLPMEDRFSAGITKRLLREAFAQRLPHSIVGNHRKIGFATPFERWAGSPGFQTLLGELRQSAEFRGRRIWDAQRLGDTLGQAQAITRGFPVWRFLSAEMWLRQAGITNA